MQELTPSGHDRCWLDCVEGALAQARGPQLVHGSGIDQPSLMVWSRHALSDPTRVNEAIHDAIAAGAHGVVLQLAAPGQFGLAMRFDAIAEALQRVDLARTAVMLDAGDQYVGALQCLMALWEAQSVPRPARLGGAPADPLGTLAQTGALEAGVWQTLDVMASISANMIDEAPQATLCLADGRPYHEAGASPPMELAAMLGTLADYRRALTYEGLKPAYVYQALSIGLSVTADLNIAQAKMRAADVLVRRLTDGRSLPLHVTSSWRAMSRKTAAERLLAGAKIASAAHAGGANHLTMLPYDWPGDSPHSLAQRVAINLVGHASAYRLDPAPAAMIDGFVSKGWELYQLIEQNGGQARLLLSGALQDMVDASAHSDPEPDPPDDDWQQSLNLGGIDALAQPLPTAITSAETRIRPLRIASASRPT